MKFNQEYPNTKRADGRLGFRATWNSKNRNIRIARTVGVLLYFEMASVVLTSYLVGVYHFPVILIYLVSGIWIFTLIINCLWGIKTGTMMARGFSVIEGRLVNTYNWMILLILVWGLILFAYFRFFVH